MNLTPTFTLSTAGALGIEEQPTDRAVNFITGLSIGDVEIDKTSWTVSEEENRIVVSA